jgi:hypothetical protein
VDLEVRMRLGALRVAGSARKADELARHDGARSTPVGVEVSVEVLGAVVSGEP